MYREEIQDKVNFVIKFGKALHSCGVAAHNLENALSNISATLGLEAEVFATPTVIMAAFNTESGQITSLTRVQPGDVDIRKITLIDALGDKVSSSKIDIIRATRELERITKLKSVYPAFVEVLAFAIAAGSASVFFGGGFSELILSAISGVIVGLINTAMAHNDKTNKFFEFITAFIIAVLNGFAFKLLPEFSTSIVSLASLIVLIPGLTLTVAITELATHNLAAGTARLMQAILVLFKLGFGLAFGNKIIELAGYSDSSSLFTTQSFPSFCLFIALLTASLGFTILFKINFKNFGWVILAGSLGFFSSKLAAGIFGADLGTFLAGFSVGLTGNFYARLKNQPAALITMPGIILLVPGSIGFKGLQFLFEKNTLEGINTTFEMFLIAIALVSGLLIANILLVPKRSL